MLFGSKSPAEKMQELDSCISSWKAALKFGGSQDAEFREFCKTNISRLGRKLTSVARKVMEDAKEYKRKMSLEAALREEED